MTPPELSALYDLSIGFIVNLISSLIVVRLIYHLAAKRRDYVFTFMLVSTSVYFLCTLLSDVEIQMGFALGLFAIFSIIRYRTDAIPIREMSYLFIVIALAIINALANKTAGWGLIIIANIGIAGLSFIMERVWFVKHIATKIVIYDRIDLIKEGYRSDLKIDLEKRTGVKIDSIEIGEIDLLRDTAIIKVHYLSDKNPGHFEGETSVY